MIDLNVEMVHDVSTCEENSEAIMKLKMQPEGSTTHMDDSGTSSSSSVVSADEESPNITYVAEDEDSSGSIKTTFNFDILKKTNLNLPKTQLADGSNLVQDLASKLLFPVIDDSGSSSTYYPQAQWLNLAFSDSIERSELQTFQQKQPQQPPVKKSRRGPRSRSSQYRGVTFYRRTGRWESHIWDCGKQVYLGGFDTAHAAARAYDRAALKFRGVEADINFNFIDYEDDLKKMKDLNKEEFVHILRRQSTGFSRGSSKYRGVTLNQCGRWEPQMGQFLGIKAYEKSALKCDGREAVTNFEPNTHGRNTISDANNTSGVHNLELSLGISPANLCPAGNGRVKPFHLPFNLCEMPNRDSLMAESSPFGPVSGQIPHGLAMSSKHPFIWPAMPPPTSLPKYEDQDVPNKDDTDSSPRFSNWAWQMHNQGSATPMPFYTNAASSGFSPTFPAQFVQKNNGRGLYLPEPSASSTIASHYYR